MHTHFAIQTANLQRTPSPCVPSSEAHGHAAEADALPEALGLACSNSRRGGGEKWDTVTQNMFFRFPPIGGLKI